MSISEITFDETSHFNSPLRFLSWVESARDEISLFKESINFMVSKYPKLPSRRAFFVAQTRGVGRSEDLLIYTYWGERVQQDLRHELTHALLHSVLKDVPLWLDEGLAEYYELLHHEIRRLIDRHRPQHRVRREGSHRLQHRLTL